MTGSMMRVGGGDWLDLLDSLYSARTTKRKSPLATTHSETNVNVRETEEEYIISLAAPGLEREDFNVRIDRGVLTISSSVKEADREKNYSSFGYRSFTRSWTLPAGVETDNIAAIYRNGILSVTIQKPSDEKGSSIQIEVT